MRAEGVKREYNDGLTIEERIQRIEHNLDLLAAAQERSSRELDAAQERFSKDLAAAQERSVAAHERSAAEQERSDKDLAAMRERSAKAEREFQAGLERLRNANTLLMNSLETRAEWEARMSARVEQAEKDAARHVKNMTRIETTIAEIGDKLNGLIGYVDGMKRDDRPPR